MNNVWTNKNSHLSDAKSGGNELKVDKLWYSFPVGDFKFTVGALQRTTTWWKHQPVTNPSQGFQTGWLRAVMGATPVGAGMQWRQNVKPGEAAFNIAANYVADGGEGASSDSELGMFGRATNGYFLSQVGYGNRKWYISALYAHKQGADGSTPAMGYSTPAASSYDKALNAVGIRGYWSPEESGFIPTISAGFDYGVSDADEEGKLKKSRLDGWPELE